MCDYVEAVYAANKDEKVMKIIADSYNNFSKEDSVKLSNIKTILDSESDLISDGRNIITNITYIGDVMYIHTECAYSLDDWFTKYLLNNVCRLSIKQTPFQSDGMFICYDNIGAFNDSYVHIDVSIYNELLEDVCLCDSYASEKDAVNALRKWLSPLIETKYLLDFSTLEEFQCKFEDYFDGEDDFCNINYYSSEGVA